MAFCSRKKWIAFSPGVQELRVFLTSWLERTLGKTVTRYEGSDSVIYDPGKWSKYKLVPYDAGSMPPLAGLDEGVLICIDRDECLRLGGGMPIEQQFPRVPWHPHGLLYKVRRERTYRVMAVPLVDDPEHRREVLSEIEDVMRRIERA